MQQSHGLFAIAKLLVTTLQQYSCMQHDNVMSICLSVRLSNAWIVTKRNKLLSKFLYRIKRSGCLVFGHEEWLVGRPVLPQVLGQSDPTPSKTAASSQYLLAAPQPLHIAKKVQLENVSIAKAFQLEAARCRAVPIRFDFVARARLKSLSLSVAVFERYYCWYVSYTVTLNFDLVTLTFDLEHL